jgi:glucose-1-phosphate cytidylyltransferase
LKVVILCGGKGTRLREETEYRPKPMVPIGDRPVLWHVMKTYAAHGHKDFVLCLGYKGEMIKDFFRNYLWATSNVSLRLGRSPRVQFHDHHGEEDWNVTLADTGQETMTAGRIARVERYLSDDELFLLTYGDGVGNVDVNKTIEFHKSHGKLLTLTAVHPPGRFGELGMATDGRVSQFKEKPQAEGGWINGGYFVASRKIFFYVQNCDDVMFEQEPIPRIAADGELIMYQHNGSMDTYQEYLLLNRLWAEGKASWRIW